MRDIPDIPLNGTRLSFSHSIRIIVEQRREFRIDDPNKSGSNDDDRDDGRRQLMIFTFDDRIDEGADNTSR